MSLNKSFHIGNLTKNPEIKHTPNGLKITSFGLAVNMMRNVNGQQKNETVFMDFTAFGKLAENIERFCQKGSSVFVESHLVMQSYVDKNTGKPQHRLRFIADSVQFLDRKQKQDQEQEHRYSREDTMPSMPHPQNETVPGIEDDLPPF